MRKSYCRTHHRETGVWRAVVVGVAMILAVVIDGWLP